MTDGEYARRSARVLVADAADRLLLLEMWHDPRRRERGTFFLTPGGGVAPGEPLATAAARELREETGLLVDPAALGPVVATTSGRADFPWLAGLFRDDFFFLRVDAHDVIFTALEDYEHDFLVGARWWTAAELAATTATVYPDNLAALFAALLIDPAPAEPTTLPWHH